MYFAQGITTFDLSDVYAGGRAVERFGEALKMAGPDFRKGIEIIAKINVVGGGTVCRIRCFLYEVCMCR
jgi:predicted oxidoreductase